MEETPLFDGLPIALLVLALVLVAYIIVATGLAWRRRHRLTTVTEKQVVIERRVDLLEGALEDLAIQVANKISGSQALIIANTFGRVVSVEGDFPRLFGYAAEEVIGRALIDLMPERYRAAHLATFGRTGDEALNRFVQVHGLHKDGHEFPVQIRLGSFAFDHQRMFYGLVTTPPGPIESDSVLR